MKTNFKIMFLCLAVALSMQAVGQQYTRASIDDTQGFNRNKATYLTQCTTNAIGFNGNVVKRADSLGAYKDIMKCVRNAISFPTYATLMQKVIPLKDTAYYMPTKQGEIGNFVAVAADVCHLVTSAQVYQGLSLNYNPTPFSPNTGYAVLRFKIDTTDTSKLRIPNYQSDMQLLHGINDTSGGYPYRGTGFTGGGVPEYKLTTRIKPQGGAEMYKVDTSGNETLMSTYDAGVGQWK